MINFLHTFEPQAIFLSFGPFNIYYYGLFIVIGIIFGLFTALKLGDKYGIKKSFIIDFSFYLIIAAIISARIFHILLELPFYLENPSQMIKIWEGGLAIHGAIIAGVITSYVLTKKEDVKFWVLVSILTPGLAFAQALGRWGNYFNQELFGKPTSLPWGIPISPENRVSPYFYSEYYHPTFIYESIGSFLIFLVLVFIHYNIIKNKRFSPKICVYTYLILYSVLRFSLEFIRIDYTPIVLGLRTPQITSLVIIGGICIFELINRKKRKGLEKK